MVQGLDFVAVPSTSLLHACVWKWAAGQEEECPGKGCSASYRREAC